MNHDKTENEIIAVFSEYDRLIEEINELRAEIVRLTALRDDLVLHICPKLRAQYEEEIGCIEREIFAAKMYLREKQMILENLRAQLNRQEIVSYEKAAKKAGEEREQFEEELKRKTKEAEENKEKWHKTAWSSFTGGDEEDKSDHQDGSGDAQSRTEKTTEQDPDKDKKSDSNDRSDSSEYGDSKDRNSGAEEEEEAPRKRRSIKEEIKNLYRKIVKRLHPDTHENVTEREKDLFNEAQKAYHDGDYDALKRIWEELQGMEDPKEHFSDTPEDLKKLRELRRKLRTVVSDLQSEIASIRGSFPYTMKELLENEDLLREYKEKMQKLLRELREADEKLAELIRTVQEKIARGEYE